VTGGHFVRSFVSSTEATWTTMPRPPTPTLSAALLTRPSSPRQARFGSTRQRRRGARRAPLSTQAVLVSCRRAHVADWRCALSSPCWRRSCSPRGANSVPGARALFPRGGRAAWPARVRRSSRSDTRGQAARCTPPRRRVATPAPRREAKPVASAVVRPSPTPLAPPVAVPSPRPIGNGPGEFL
jgi:hypothetical protein